MHSKKEQNVHHSIRDFSQEIDDLSREIKELKIANEALQSQLMVQSQHPPIDLRTIKIVKKKKNENNKKMTVKNEKDIEDKDDEENKDNNKKLT
jgi:hypothetical protein